MSTTNQSWYNHESSLPLPDLHGKSDILEQQHIRELSRFLPARAEGYAWTLAFTTTHMGFSLKSLYRSLSKYEGPVLLIIKDTEHNVFGAFASCSLKPSESFYGTGETYLFTFKQPSHSTASQSTINNDNNSNNNNNINNNNNNNNQSNTSTTTITSNTSTMQQQQSQPLTFKRFPWTGENLYFIKGNMDSIVFGAGEGNFGIWLDEDLYHGTTHDCRTFNNEPLTNKQDFFVSALECWCFL